MFWKQIFAKKSLDELLEEMAGEHRLRRILGPVALSSLGIGAIVGTGIFVLTGVAARQLAGPGLILSFVIAGIACAFSALCYAEFASMAPIAGSAYTYAYISLGEIIAWIIGWDLILEYAMASATVANGWAHYFLGLFKTKGGQALLMLPTWLATDPFTASTQHIDYQTAKTLVVASATAVPYDPSEAAETARLPLPVADDSPIHRVRAVEIAFTADSQAAVKALHGEKEAEASVSRLQEAMASQLQYEPALAPAEKLAQLRDGNESGFLAYNDTPLVIGGIRLTCNIVAIAIIAVISAVLVVGIRESAGFNAIMVLVKIAAVFFVIVAGARWINPTNWTPFLPYGWEGVGRGAALVFFAYIGFDSVSTHAEEARNPKVDVPIGIITSLVVCTILYIAVAAVITGMIPYPQIPLNRPIAGVFESKGMAFASVIITVGALTGITSVLLVMLLSLPRVLLAMARDGLLPFSFFGAVHPRFRTPHRATILGGIVVGLTASLFPLETLGHMVNIGTLFAFVVVCGSVWLMRWISPNAERPFRTPAMHVVAPLGILMCLVLMWHLDWQNWLRLGVWLGVGLVIYLSYGRRHSHLGKELRGEISLHGVTPAGTALNGETPENAAE
jgi:APA family basic amino acid/polyamine antiporter